MIQIPKELLSGHPFIQVRNTPLQAVVLNWIAMKEENDTLQTCHCLELVLSGSAEVRYAGREQRISAGDIQFRKRGNYQIHHSGDYQALLFFMENEFIEDFLRQHILNYSPTSDRLFDSYTKDSFHPEESPFLFKAHDLIRGSMEQALQSITNPGTFSSCLVRMSAHNILLLLLSMDGSHAYVNFLKYLISYRKTDLHYFMESTFRQQMSLKEMARLSGRSESTFKKDFNEVFQMSPFKWLLQRRLEYANYLLKNSGRNISEVAAEAGFENLSHFSRSYKAKYGYAPGHQKHKR